MLGSSQSTPIMPLCIDATRPGYHCWFWGCCAMTAEPTARGAGPAAAARVAAGRDLAPGRHGEDPRHAGRSRGLLLKAIRASPTRVGGAMRPAATMVLASIAGAARKGASAIPTHQSTTEMP